MTSASNQKFTIQYHAGNPNLCRIPELVIRQMPEWEGGGYFLTRSQAEMILHALNSETEK